MFVQRFCDCAEAWKIPGREVQLHGETQDTSTDAWKRLLDLVEDAAAKSKCGELAPGRVLTPEDWHSIITLPSSIGKLKYINRLYLYGSSLVRIPPQIGDMSALDEFVPYTSYQLHWLPFEITRCGNLKNSTISTRALYGNYKTRSPFPDLRAAENQSILESLCPESCSVCRGPFSSTVRYRWITLRVATDVVPLLVFACSSACLQELPETPDHYRRGPHRGGRSIEQRRR